MVGPQSVYLEDMAGSCSYRFPGSGQVATMHPKCEDPTSGQAYGSSRRAEPVSGNRDSHADSLVGPGHAHDPALALEANRMTRRGTFQHHDQIDLLAGRKGLVRLEENPREAHVPGNAHPLFQFNGDRNPEPCPPAPFRIIRSALWFHQLECRSPRWFAQFRKGYIFLYLWIYLRAKRWRRGATFEPGCRGAEGRRRHGEGEHIWNSEKVN